MQKNESEILKNLEFLVVKSRDLLQEQLKSFESANTKAGILISISALLIPIAVTFISSTDSIAIIKYLTILPTALMIIALIYLLKVLMPKGLDHGFNFEQFENHIDKSYKDLLLFEIGANKDSYSDNNDIVIRQIKNFKTGIKLIFCSSILIFTLVTLSLFIPKTDSKVSCEKEIKTEQFFSNKPNLETMSESNSNNDSSSNSGQNQQSQQSTQESTRIPSVPREQRANLEKGEDSKPLTKK